MNTPIRIAGVGDNVVDCYTAAGLMFPGGNTLNVAAFTTRFGARSAYFGQVAQDPAGEHIRAALEAEGVDVSRLRNAPGHTAYCLIGHDEHGDRHFIADDLGVSRFELSDDDLAALRDFDAAHIGATSGLDAFIVTVADRTRLSYDFSTRRDLEHIDRIGPSAFLTIHSGGDLADDEFDDLVSASERSGAEWSLVTRGTAGSVLSHAGRRWTGEAQLRGTAIDTLGAGDTFASRVLVGLLRNESPASILRAAADAAAETCAHLGAFGHGAPLRVAALTPTGTFEQEGAS